MCHHQHSQIDQYLKPMLQRNFITLLPGKFSFIKGINYCLFFYFLGGLAEHVLSLLDAKSLCASACVSKAWRRAIAHGMLWRKLIERKVRINSMWRGLSEKRGWYVNYMINVISNKYFTLGWKLTVKLFYLFTILF